jgi:ABC-type glutathione transport system ATPase component
VVALPADLRETQRLALVLVSHDLRLVAEHTTEAIVPHDGHVIENGPTREVLSAEATTKNR